MAKSNLPLPDLLEEYRYQLAGGPLPRHRVRKAQQAACLGCIVRFLFLALLIALGIFLVRVLL